MVFFSPLRGLEVRTFSKPYQRPLERQSKPPTRAAPVRELWCYRWVVFPVENLTRDNHGLLDAVGLSPAPVLLNELVGVGVPAQHFDGPCIIWRSGDVLVDPSCRVVPVHRRASSPHP